MSDEINIDIDGGEELQAAFDALPITVKKESAKTMDASLSVLEQNVPDYDTIPQPEGTNYVRTQTLGRSLARNGPLNITKTKDMAGGYQGEFGSNVSYSKWVVGDKTQATIHQGRWYVMGDIAKKSIKEIERLWNIMADRITEIFARTANK